ncbi:MAG: hypothetical protein WBN68_19465, partial [Sedimenticolaceae bacterium]
MSETILIYLGAKSAAAKALRRPMAQARLFDQSACQRWSSDAAMPTARQRSQPAKGVSAKGPVRQRNRREARFGRRDGGLSLFADQNSGRRQPP